MDWIKFSDEIPPAQKIWLWVYGDFFGHKNYVDRCFWEKTDFGELHEDTMRGATHWMICNEPIPPQE